MRFPRDGSDALIAAASWFGVAAILGLFMFGYAIVAVVTSLGTLGLWTLWRRYRGPSITEANSSLKSDRT